MLVLSRKRGQTISLGSDIEIHVLGVSGDVVKLGIQAPVRVQVLRGELFRMVVEANRGASHTGDDLITQVPHMEKPAFKIKVRRIPK
jgi:carbon storage regulator